MPESGSAVAVAGVAGPVMKPLFQTRSTPDVLFDVARRLRKPLAFTDQTFDGMLKTSFEALGRDVWTAAIERGGWWGELPQTAVNKVAAGPPIAGGISPARYAAPQFDGDAGQYPLHFLPYPSTAFLDGSLSHLPWLQELPDPITSAMWNSWIEVNPRTAAGLGISQGDVVEATSRSGTVRAPAFINPALAPDVVAMPVGQGHTNFTRYAHGARRQPVRNPGADHPAETGALAWAATRIRLARIAQADGRLILFAGAELHEEPHKWETR